MILNCIAVALSIYFIEVCQFQQRIVIRPSEVKPRRFYIKKFNKKSLSKNFYRIYKFIAVQSVGGAHIEDIYKNLHKVIHDKGLKKEFQTFSILLSQRHDVDVGLDYLKEKLDFEEGHIFVDILISMTESGLSSMTFQKLDHMMFQKYLSEIRLQTERVKQSYFYAVVVFTLVVVGMLLIPLIHQMVFSTNKIFI
jgi:hypothetical protein